MRRNLVGAAIAAVIAVGVLAAPRTAHAYEWNGVAMGADVSLGGTSGLALNIGLGAMELEFLVGMSFTLSDGSLLRPGLSAAVGFFATIAEGDTTNFQLGGRLGAIMISNVGVDPISLEQRLDTFGIVTIEADARVEHRLDDHAVLIFQVGFVVQIAPELDPVFQFGLGNSGFVGGAGFRYAFEALGGGGIAPAPMPTSTTSTTTSTPTQTQTQTTTTTTETGTTSETPYWEQ